MTHVTFVEPNGGCVWVAVEDGQSLMQAAVHNSVPGIDGDCGGSCACATCHVYVEFEWVEKLPPQDETEKSLLQFAHGVEENSRLACQIKISGNLDGLVVRLPNAQH